jgi:HD-GYP domain-containing protein (c-di-GMP phosphodiesterase class II)
MTGFFKFRVCAAKGTAPTLSFAALTIFVILLATVGTALVLKFADVQEKREILSWQNKLNLIADSRAADMDAWIGRHFKELGLVASNPSLQLYLTELQLAPAPKAQAEEPAQMVFLRNLLVITADRLGFISKLSPEVNAIKANVQAPSGTGIAIVDNSGKIVVSSVGLSSLDADLSRKIAETPKGSPSFINLFLSPSGEGRIGFVIPIYPIQGDATAAQQIGKLVGIKKLDSDFFKLLKHPGATEPTLESVLLQKDEGNVDAIEPQGEDRVATRKLALSTPELDAVYAVTSTGTFAVLRNGNSRSSLMTSRPIANTPWALMVHIERESALAESDRWRQQTETIMFLSLFAVLFGIAAIWYYAATKRTKLLAESLAAKEKLLRVVADNQLESVLMVDAQDVAHFANRAAADNLRATPESVCGKDLTSLFGAARADEYAKANARARSSEKPFVREWRLIRDLSEKTYRSAHIPLDHIPVDNLPQPTPGVLIVDQDVTDTVKEREKRVHVLRSLIEALVGMVDRRDHFSANQSIYVARVAHDVALDMGLDTGLAETAEIAGKLMNIGKIVVPSEMLTRTTLLNEEEKNFIRKSMQNSIEILQNIEFEGPVVETLRQAQERFDGTGPLGLKGEAILISARIIAVVNGFVAMINSRSYRQSMSVEDAIKLLLQDQDQQFDHRVVVSLAGYIENKNGRDIISGYVNAT